MRKKFVVFFTFLTAAALIVSGSFVYGAAQYPNTPSKEFISDAPWVHRLGLTADIPLITYIKDADADAAVVDYIRYYRSDTGELIVDYNPSPDLNVNVDFWGIRVRGLTPQYLGLTYGDTLKLRVETRFRDQLIWHTYQYYLETKIAQPLPSLSGWQRGDTHYHTLWTDNEAEHGGEPQFSVEVAKAVGLTWTAITDHSYDVSAADWQAMKNFAASASTTTFQVIPGQEFSVDTNETDESVDDRIHLLGLGMSGYVAGPDIVPTFEVRASRPRSLGPVLADIQAAGGVALAAHPEVTVEVFGYGVVAPWSAQNFSSAFANAAFLGSQLLNTRTTSEDDTSVTTDNMNPFPFTPRSNWDAEWLAGLTRYDGQVRQNLPRKLFLAGGSDAHGDANYQTFNAQGLFDVAANDNAYGKVHTAVQVTADLSQANVLAALRRGRAVATDGPLVTLEVQRTWCRQTATVAGLGDRLGYRSGDRLVVRAVSSPEFGGLTSATLTVLTPSAQVTRVLPLSGMSATTAVSLGSLGVAPPFAVRVDGLAAAGYRSFSNPIWFDQSSAALQACPKNPVSPEATAAASAQ